MACLGAAVENLAHNSLRWDVDKFTPSHAGTEQPDAGLITLSYRQFFVFSAAVASKSKIFLAITPDYMI